MYYSNEFIKECANKISHNHMIYINIQMNNIVKLLNKNRENYKLFGVYWWAVKDALRAYVNNNAWYCGKQDDPLMKQRAWHNSEFYTIIAAMLYYNEKHFLPPSSECYWFDNNNVMQFYTLDDPDSYSDI